MEIMLAKIYGAEGHRQRMSFSKSVKFETDKGSEVIILNSDVTGTNDYSLVIIKADTELDCFHEMQAQIDDGYFEDSRVSYDEEEWIFLCCDECNRLIDIPARLKKIIK